MRKIGIVCPFNDKPCNLCGMYRARHYYAGLCGPKKEGKRQDDGDFFIDFETLLNEREEEELKDIKLRVIEMESGEIKICTLDEARNWDFKNPEIIRMVNGIHVTSFEKLLKIIRFVNNGQTDTIDLYEGHRFILLGGG